MTSFPIFSFLRSRAFSFGVAALVGSLPASGADDLNSWSHYQDVYYDTSPTGADVAATIGNFPVLVRLRAANFPFNQAMGGGQDLRFAKPNGTPINYEIERWDSAGAKADVWLRIDTLPGDSQGVMARMYWGKPASVSRSDGNSVFSPTIGFEYVWHLGGAGTGARPNSVSAKPAAATANYDGDESKEGMAGLCDSLDGNSPGDYLDAGDGFTEFANGMTISLWANPSRASVWGRFFDLGNGAGADNIMLARRSNSEDLLFQLYGTSSQLLGTLTAPAGISLDQWQFFAVTVSGTSASLYRNGALVASGTFSAPVSNTQRASNYLGRSNWSADEYFAGKLDEVEMSHGAHSANWFKLAYANQKADQNLIGFTPPPAFCAAANFGAPADTSLPEASSLVLTGVADCATSYQWSIVSGPAPRILDPEVKVLQVALPRVLGDTAIVYRFSAVAGGSVRTRDVVVQIRETIPEPAFSLSNASWSGKDSLLVQPNVENLSVIRASREPTIAYAWSLTGGAIDTVWKSGGLLLRSAPDGSVLNVGLCLSNNGPQICRTATVTVSQAVGVSRHDGAIVPARAPIRRDVRGRRLLSAGSVPAFPSHPR